ncbi:hypothetical protein KK079_21985, partial [Enterobacter hormaechei subsp. xiangfangensis]|nr:hypothetical protein [Enterobacter hormaechei subsp. xiangfangensis]
GEGELMAHDVPLGCAPDEYDDLISGTCSHLPNTTILFVASMLGDENVISVHNVPYKCGFLTF